MGVLVDHLKPKKAGIIGQLIVMAGLFNRFGVAGIFALRVGLIAAILACVIAL